MAKLRRVRPGEPITAALFNALVEAIEARDMLEAAPPLELTRTKGRSTLKLGYLFSIVVFELSEAISPGSSAAAKIIWYDGASWVDADTALISVYDAIGTMTGDIGDRGYAYFDRQSGLWHILNLQC